MNRLLIERFAYFATRTIGVASYGDEIFYTVENPWMDNERNVSCIPEGTYDMVRVNSPKYGENTWEIADVPNRSHILIHKGNWATDVQGCICFGRGLFSDLDGVTNSANAVSRFYQLTKGIESMPVHITHKVIDMADAT